MIRRMTPEGFLVGRSVHSAEEAAAVDGVDYLIAGTVWSSASKPGAITLLGLDGFLGDRESGARAVLAIGGVTIDRVGDVASAGGAGIAAIGLFMGDADHQCRAVQLDAIANGALAV